MKTLHFISLTSYFVSIHVIVRLTHTYQNSSRITIMQFLFKSQVNSSVNARKTCSLCCTCSGTGISVTALKLTRKFLQLSTDNKKQFIVTKCLHLATARLSKDQRNQIIGVLKAGSTVNDISHQFGCSRHTVHNLMNQYNSSGSVRVHARPGRSRMKTFRPYHVNTFTHPRSRFNAQPLLLGIYGVHAQKILSHLAK